MPGKGAFSDKYSAFRRSEPLPAPGGSGGGQWQHGTLTAADVAGAQPRSYEQFTRKGPYAQVRDTVRLRRAGRASLAPLPPALRCQRWIPLGAMPCHPLLPPTSAAHVGQSVWRGWDAAAQVHAQEPARHARPEGKSARAAGRTGVCTLTGRSEAPEQPAAEEARQHHVCVPHCLQLSCAPAPAALLQLDISDIPGAHPASDAKNWHFHSPRGTNPLDPQYKLPSAKEAPAPAPKFLRDTLDVSDIEGAQVGYAGGGGCG